MRGLSDDARAWGRPAVIGLATVLVLLLDLIFGAGTIYPHLFYLIIVPAAFWYGRRAVAAGLLLAAVHIAVETLLHGSPGAAVAIQAGSFIVAAYLLGYLFEIASRRADGLHFRIGEQAPGAPACDRNTRRLISRLTSRDPDARYQAAGCLGDAGDPAAVAPLAALLKDEESGVRWKAVEALGKMGSPAVGPLTESLQSPDPDVRWMAAVALGDIGDPAAIPALMGALDDPDTYVRSRAALALAAIGEPARAGLIASLRDGNEWVRWGAALALGSIGGRAPLPRSSVHSATPNRRCGSGPAVRSAISGMPPFPRSSRRSRPTRTACGVRRPPPSASSGGRRSPRSPRRSAPATGVSAPGRQRRSARSAIPGRSMP